MQSNKKITQEALFYLQSLAGSDLGRLFNEIEKIDIFTKKITQEALFYLQSLAGSDLGRLFNEIEKIDIYTKDQKTIEKEDVMITIGGSEAVNIFKVLDSVGDKDIKNAMDGLVKLNQGNLHHLAIFAMIYRQIKLILQAKLFYELLNIADLEFKNSQKEPKIILEELVVKIINQRNSV